VVYIRCIPCNEWMTELEGSWTAAHRLAGSHNGKAMHQQQLTIVHANSCDSQEDYGWHSLICSKACSLCMSVVALASQDGGAMMGWLQCSPPGYIACLCGCREL